MFSHFKRKRFIQLKSNKSFKHCIAPNFSSLCVCLQQGGVGMSGSLVDDEQFPRADVDVYTVRYSRQRVICN